MFWWFVSYHQFATMICFIIFLQGSCEGASGKFSVEWYLLVSECAGWFELIMVKINDQFSHWFNNLRPIWVQIRSSIMIRVPRFLDLYCTVENLNCLFGIMQFVRGWPLLSTGLISVQWIGFCSIMINPK